jgi:uncharacterized protein (TIGR00269 family)
MGYTIKMNVCKKCSGKAIINLRYNGVSLCKDHFMDFVEKRVKRAVREQGKLPDRGRIAVAVSGGSDSLVSLKFINEMLAERPGVEVHAISVDEGIRDYRSKTLKLASTYSEKWGVPWHLSLMKEEIGYSIDELAKLEKTYNECTYCGVFRRWVINKKAKTLRAIKIVTGHQLDDQAETILMNLLTGDLKRLSRLGPHRMVRPGLIPRLMPLRYIPKEEIMLYAKLVGIEVMPKVCPYSKSAFRGNFRKFLNELEIQRPGTKYALLSSYDGMKEFLSEIQNMNDLRKCRECGEPSSGDLCKRCELIKSLNESLNEKIQKSPRI